MINMVHVYRELTVESNTTCFGVVPVTEKPVKFRTGKSGTYIIYSLWNRWTSQKSKTLGMSALTSALEKLEGFDINDLPETRDDPIWTGLNSIQGQFNLTPLEVSALKNRRCGKL